MQNLSEFLTVKCSSQTTLSLCSNYVIYLHVFPLHVPDIDNNGYLDKNDFECLAVRTTVIESKGDFTQEKYEENRKVMQNHWIEIADLADFNKVCNTDVYLTNTMSPVIGMF